MTDETILANATLVLPNETVRGSVVLHAGHIASVDTGHSVPKGAEDCAGALVMPGLVELHTDNLERHLFPRPKVNWPRPAAVLAHDAELAGVGITTVFDAIRIGSIVTGTGDYARYAREMADTIAEARNRGILKIAHHLHLRAEICSETLLEELSEFDAGDRVGIVSLMDHTPGQRQFADISKYEDYVRGKHGLSKDDFDAHAAHLSDLRHQVGDAHQAAVVNAAREFGATLASHDDSTAPQVATSRDHGTTLAEFPTTEEAALACRAAGIAVMMGAPNLMRGGSHSGNVSAEALAGAGLLDVLSSDYVPASLLTGAIRLGEMLGDLPRGIAAVTSAPARIVGLCDRGELREGLRADVIRVTLRDGLPSLCGVWCKGRRVS